jgi:hypothetical protein
MTRCIWRRLEMLGESGFIRFYSHCYNTHMVEKYGYQLKSVPIEGPYVCEDCDLREWKEKNG